MFITKYQALRHIEWVKNKEKPDTKSIELSWCYERLSYNFMFERRIIEPLRMSKNQSKTADFFDTTFDIVAELW